jgi:DNA-binding NarL/FixJ family response regulator
MNAPGTLEKLYGLYNEIMNEQVFDETQLDTSLLQKHKQFAENMAKVGNSGITIFDLHRKEHVFTSYNFTDLFGYEPALLEKGGNDYFNSKVHPDDFILLLKNGINAFRYFFSVEKEKRMQLKAINEYRIQNAAGKYIRVIEQHQALELDAKGNVWLSLGVIDISPNQEDYKGIRSSIVNYKTGEIVLIKEEKDASSPIELSEREIQILSLIKDGMLSKEISVKLLISVHTVNTHRQRILQKLKANNSMEAVKTASSLGLLV